DLTFSSTNLGTAAMGVLQVGDNTTSGTWDVVLDDAAFATSRLGPGGDTTPPIVPANLSATANSASSAHLTWDASTDNVGVSGFAAEGATTNTSANAKETLPSTFLDAYARVAFKVNGPNSQVTLLRLRDTSVGTNGGFIALTSGGKLQFKDASGTSTTSAVTPSQGAWHVLELHLSISNGVVEVWLDGAAVSDLTLSGANLGAAPIGTPQ